MAYDTSMEQAGDLDFVERAMFLLASDATGVRVLGGCAA